MTKVNKIKKTIRWTMAVGAISFVIWNFFTHFISVSKKGIGFSDYLLTQETGFFPPMFWVIYLMLNLVTAFILLGFSLGALGWIFNKIGKAIEWVFTDENENKISKKSKSKKRMNKIKKVEQKVESKPDVAQETRLKAIVDV